MAKALKKPKKKAVNGYKMPDPLPKGEILIDISKKQWRLGTSIGKGGFGEIYSAQEASKSSSKYPYVIKVEPHENGPLFVEMHFYMKIAKQADIDAFKQKHKLKTFGMPAYLGSGSHEVGNIKYRFIVMEKFGTDLDKLRHKNHGVLSVATVFQLAWQMTYVLEYIHGFGYVHADIKGGNILMGCTPETKSQAFLVDFGLATKFSTDKEFKPNPKKAHDGTIEYLSRDAHQGVPTRRGDFEILGYNMIHWLGGKLPWESKLSYPKEVQQMKEECMSDLPKFMKSCFGSETAPSTLIQFLKYVNTLKFNEEPNYKKIRELFKQEIQKNGSTVSGSLEFDSGRKRRSLLERETPEKKTKEEEDEEKKVKGKSRKKNTENGDEEVSPRRSGRGKKLETVDYKEEPNVDVREKMPRSKGKTLKKQSVESDSEDEVPQRRGGRRHNEINHEELSDGEEKAPRRNGRVRKKEKENENTNGEVLTAAMKEILDKKEKNATKKKKNVKSSQENTETQENFEGYTPEMIEIKMKKLKKEKSTKNKSKF